MEASGGSVPPGPEPRKGAVLVVGDDDRSSVPSLQSAFKDWKKAKKKAAKVKICNGQTDQQLQPCIMMN